MKVDVYLRKKKREDDEKRIELGVDGSLQMQQTCNKMVKIKSKIVDIKKLTDETKLTNGANIEGPN